MSGFAGSINDLFKSDEPDMKSKLVVFDPKVFNRTKGLLTDWSTNRNQWKDTFANWKTDFDASEGEFKSNIGAENDYLKFIRDGGMEGQLSGLRARERASDAAQRENALDFAGGASDFAKFAGGGGIGNSSADFARRLRAGRRIEAEFGDRDATRERRDLDWMNNLKLNTMGRVNANLDKLINRQLLPQQLSDSELMGMIQSLGAIQGVRMGSAQPVFWRERGIGEKLAATTDQLLSSYGIGGKPSQNAPTTGTGGGGAPSYTPVNFGDSGFGDFKISLGGS